VGWLEENALLGADEAFMAVRKTKKGLALKRWFKEDCKCRKVGAANYGNSSKKKKKAAGGTVKFRSGGLARRKRAVRCG